MTAMRGCGHKHAHRTAAPGGISVHAGMSIARYVDCAPSVIKRMSGSTPEVGGQVDGRFQLAGRDTVKLPDEA